MEKVNNSEEYLNPLEINDAINSIMQFINVVNSGGATDVENPLALQFLQRYQSGKPITRNEHMRMMGQLGDPTERSSNYH